jgi:hypothetical protein
MSSGDSCTMQQLAKLKQAISFVAVPQGETHVLLSWVIQWRVTLGDIQGVFHFFSPFLLLSVLISCRSDPVISRTRGILILIRVQSSLISPTETNYFRTQTIYPTCRATPPNYPLRTALPTISPLNPLPSTVHGT